MAITVGAFIKEVLCIHKITFKSPEWFYMFETKGKYKNRAIQKFINLLVVQKVCSPICSNERKIP